MAGTAADKPSVGGRILAAQEVRTIERELGSVWLPSRRRLLHKMAEIVVGPTVAPIEVVSIFWAKNLVPLPYYKKTEAPKDMQLLAVGRLATQRLLRDGRNQLPQDLRHFAAVRGVELPVRIDSCALLGNPARAADAALPTVAWACLLADGAVQIQGGEVGDGAFVVADWQPAQQQESPVRPQLRIIPN